MTWLSTTPFELADPTLREVYERIRALYPVEYAADVPAVTHEGKSDSVVSAHSLIPEAMWHMMAGLAALLRSDLPLTRRQQEMIATVVSAQNECFY